MTLDLELLEAIYTNKDNDLRSLSDKGNVMLIFLRHFGCVFCHEALDDTSKVLPQLKAMNIKVVFVHMAEDNIADEYLAQYGIESEEHISDPDMSLYEYFGLNKGNFIELYGLKIWQRYMQLDYKSERDPKLGNIRQMPGIFLIHKDQVLNSYVHSRASDKPDYFALASLKQDA